MTNNSFLATLDDVVVVDDLVDVGLLLLRGRPHVHRALPDKQQNMLSRFKGNGPFLR